eukprot:9542712-Karenia_brevis.AAC.1
MMIWKADTCTLSDPGSDPRHYTPHHSHHHHFCVRKLDEAKCSPLCPSNLVHVARTTTSG